MVTVMNIIKIVQLIVSLVTTGMKIMEEMLGEGAGKTKKEAVMAFIKGALSPEVFEKFEGLISILVNLKALIMFGSSGDDPDEKK